jgi:hypothetical protein
MNFNKLLISNIFCFILILPVIAGGKKDTVSQEIVVSSATVDADSTALESWPTDLQPVDVDTQRIAYNHDLPDGDPVAFHEVWAYLLEGKESELDPSMPITDLCYFSAGVNIYGEVNYYPDADKIKDFPGRKHIVITCDSKSLTHFILDPTYPVREKLISQLVVAAEKFDGLQIDFELIPARDDENFRSFLKELRARLGEKKWFSVALPARVKKISDDVYDYKLISQNVDRIVVMAYDEHWSGSKPGSIASIAWCEKVAKYASTVIPEKKLIMGLPFYGRTWEDDCYASAWRFKGINEAMNDNNMHVVERKDDVIPSFTFKVQTTVTGYFEDTFSLVTRCRMYSKNNISKVAFWRIGQEDKSFWPWLQLN